MFEHREEMLGWMFTYQTKKFLNLRGMYYNCTLLVNVDRFSAGDRIDEISIDYQYGVIDFVRHPVSAMDRHENLGSYEITPVVEGVDYVAIRQEIAQANEEARQEMMANHPNGPVYLPTEMAMPNEEPNFQPADLAIAMLEKYKLPDFKQGFVERDEDDNTPANR